MSCQLMLTQLTYIPLLGLANYLIIKLAYLASSIFSLEVAVCQVQIICKTKLQCIDTYLQTQAKYFEQTREIHKNWTGQENFDIYFCVFSDFYCQSLFSRWETGHQAMSLPKFEIFLTFPYFLRSQVLSRSETREATRVPSLLYQISRFVLLVVNRVCIKTL